MIDTIGEKIISGDLKVPTLFVPPLEPAVETIAADPERPALHKLTFNDKCTVGGLPTLQIPPSIQRRWLSSEFADAFLAWEAQHNTLVNVKPGSHIEMQAEASPTKGGGSPGGVQTLFVFAKN